MTSKLAWFSYRKSFFYIFSHKNVAYSTDANWGCTIRVCQMYLFWILLNQILEANDLGDIPQEELLEIRRGLLIYFFDNIYSPFSIH